MKTEKATLTFERIHPDGSCETIYEWEVDIPVPSRMTKIKRFLLRLIKMNKIKFMISAILIAMLLTVIALLC